MTELSVLLTPVLQQILNRIITLFNGKIKIAVEIKDFSFAEMQTNYEENGFYNSAESEIKMASGNILDIVTGDKSRAIFEVKTEISKELWRPYLQTNQSELGLVVFKFPKNLTISNNFTLYITAKVAGYDKLISDKIN